LEAPPPKVVFKGKRRKRKECYFCSKWSLTNNPHNNDDDNIVYLKSFEKKSPIQTNKKTNERHTWINLCLDELFLHMQWIFKIWFHHWNISNTTIHVVASTSAIKST